MPDPAAEGWGSEAFSEKAQAELNYLLQPFAGGGKVTVVNGRFSLQPKLKEVARTTTAIIRRGQSATPAKAGTLPSALAPIRVGFKRGAALHLKLKTVAVSLPAERGGSARTTHFVHLDGPSTGGRREINAT